MKEEVHGFLYLLVGVEHHAAGAVIDEAHRQPAAQLAATRLLRESPA